MSHFTALGYNECAPLVRDFIYYANLITPSYLCAGYMFRGRISNDTPSGILVTILALRSDDGYFNKVRISYDNDSRDHSAEQVMVFLVQWYFRRPKHDRAQEISGRRTAWLSPWSQFSSTSVFPAQKSKIDNGATRLVIAGGAQNCNLWYASGSCRTERLRFKSKQVYG